MVEDQSPPVYTRRHWAKSKKQEQQEHRRVHLLEHHLADVAACFEALLEQPTIRRRLARSGGKVDLDEKTVARLCVLVALHDIGKANIGFQAQIWRAEDLPPKRKRIQRMGHDKDLVPVLCDLDHETADWFVNELEEVEFMEWDDDGGDTAIGLFIAALSHHGTPLNLSESRSANPAAWRPFGELDPRHCVKRIVKLVREWYPAAYAPGAPPLPSAPAFQHMFLGLCTLADWLGSDERIFPYLDRPQDSYIDGARARARNAVAEIGLDIGAQRNALRELPAFGALFDIDGRPNPMQEAVADLRLDEPLVIIESETGSGKTEAALLRFARLYEKGLVDGLYFALPTRSAAKQIHERVTGFVDRMFPQEHRPETVLAVPDYLLRAGGVEGRRLPNFEVLWDDQHNASDSVIRRRWAAESAKRYLAAQIAVGTVDQAMMAALTVRHAHMRAACLARNLLVVDEVHASDQYMRVILEDLLKAHLDAGGYACLMSATLGSSARRRLSSPGKIDADAGPKLEEAVAANYPAITTRGAGQENLIGVEESGRDKRVQIGMSPVMQAFDAVAARALQAARAGAKVLIIRNTVEYAVQTQQALEKLASAAEDEERDMGLLFSCGGVLTAHHSRYAAADRLRLDTAVVEQIGKERSSGGRVIVGTQTLEQSLDIDADLLITDLCPVDVLLQRIGRLHRHQRADRPENYREPACIVLTPPGADLSPWLTRRQDTNGLGPNGRVYEDLRVLEATWRLIAEHAANDTTWDIPRMNRELVEGATHCDVLAEITAKLGEGWSGHALEIEGAQIAHGLTAGHVLIRRASSFYEGNSEVCFPDEEKRIRTRLGDEGVEITLEPAARSPFAADCAIGQLAIPGHLAHGLTGEEPVSWEHRDGGFDFNVGGRSFRYDRLGLWQL
ncbi:MAG: CRISPR-associated helicase Cas3' [Caldilineaceae bacterium]|nr:CRISPR-associated helicase Cas3' [Caldilineaceae bacterium]